jgi:hypothetical protein
MRRPSRPLLRLLFCLLAGSAHAAEWAPLSETAAATVYVDPASLRRDGHRASLSELTDYREAADAPRAHRSARRDYQFDCMEGALRTLLITTYAAPMARGPALVTVDVPSQWLLFTPGSVGELLWKIACRRPPPG